MQKSTLHHEVFFAHHVDGVTMFNTVLDQKSTNRTHENLGSILQNRKTCYMVRPGSFNLGLHLRFLAEWTRPPNELEMQPNELELQPNGFGSSPNGLPAPPNELGISPNGLDCCGLA